MSEEKKPKGFQPGQSGNPEGVGAGRPKKGDNESDLRTLRTKLRKLNIKALPIIEASMTGELLDGKEPSKDQVATAKWVTNTYVAVHKQVYTEENGKSVEPDEKEEDVDAKETKTKLSLVMLDK